MNTRSSTRAAASITPEISTSGSQPSTSGTRASTSGSRLSTYATRASTSGTRPFVYGTRASASTSGTQPSTSGTQPSISGSKPSTLGSKPSTLGSKPSTSGSKPSTSGSKLSTSGSKPSTSGMQPSTSGVKKGLPRPVMIMASEPFAMDDTPPSSPVASTSSMDDDQMMKPVPSIQSIPLPKYEPPKIYRGGSLRDIAKNAKMELGANRSKEDAEQRAHEDRIKYLLNMQSALDATEWMFPSVESLMGMEEDDPNAIRPVITPTTFSDLPDLHHYSRKS